MPAKFSVAWKSPSNIAFIKYWGKKPGQVPANPSLSMSLTEAYTKTQVSAFESADHMPDLAINGKPDHPFIGKVRSLLDKMKLDFPLLQQFSFDLGTANSFPHSAGIASSASGLSAFSLSILDLVLQIEDRKLESEEFFRQASYYARIGSGSACRSVYGEFAVWGKNNYLDDSSDLYAIPFNDRVNSKFQDLQDTILIVSSKPKALSSSAGHAKMGSHPFAEARRLQAINNLDEILKCMEKGDFERFGTIVENEALILHSLIMTSDESSMLLEPGSIQIIHAVRKARKQGLPVFFTIDAGPNIHLIYPGNYSDQIRPFIQNELLPFCENSKVIYDCIGKGPERISIVEGFLS